MKMLRYRYIVLTFVTVVALNSCGLYKKISKSDTKEEITVAEPTPIDNFDFVEPVEIDTTEFVSNEPIYQADTVNDYEENIQIDSTEIVNMLLNDDEMFAKVFKNKFGKNSNISKNTQMTKGSRIVEQLDSLTKVKFLNKYEFVSDRNKLNEYGYAEDEVPEFSDSIYEMRIAKLNLQTPIELIYNEHVKSFISIYAKRGRKQTARMLGLKEIYFPIFEQVLDKYDMPFELKYLAVVESALNPTAGSRAGAKGLWQFMYHTGKRYGLKSNSLVDDRFDPYKATVAAVEHLKDLYDIYHSWELALAAYNSGPGNVNRAIRRAGGIRNYWAIWPFLPSETRGYVPAFIAVNYVFNYSTEHNIFPTDPGILADGIDSVSVTSPLTFEQISEFMGIDIEDLRFLNPSYKRDIIPATEEKSYILRLPVEKIGEFIENEQSIYSFVSSSGIEKEKLQQQIKKALERKIYVVRSGDNLGAIAGRYGISVRKLKSWNGLRSSRIYPGQKLTIFDADIRPQKRSSSRKKKSGKKYHKVKSGETLISIARTNNLSVSELRDLNNLTSNTIYPGQKLKINGNNTKISHSGSYKYHTIRSGDTLWDISRRYDIPLQKLKRWNGITNSRRLKLGDKLVVKK